MELLDKVVERDFAVTSDLLVVLAFLALADVDRLVLLFHASHHENVVVQAVLQHLFVQRLARQIHDSVMLKSITA